MIIKYAKFSKEKRVDYEDSTYLKSIEICCPEMSFALFDDPKIKILDGATDADDWEWPVKLLVQSKKAGSDILMYRCPHCGVLVEVYVNGKLCRTSEEWQIATGWKK